MSFITDNITIKDKKDTVFIEREPKVVIVDNPEAKFDSLKTEFGNKKELLEGYELQCLIALSKYPELSELYKYLTSSFNPDIFTKLETQVQQMNECHIYEFLNQIVLLPLILESLLHPPH